MSSAYAIFETIYVSNFCYIAKISLNSVLETTIACVSHEKKRNIIFLPVVS